MMFCFCLHFFSIPTQLRSSGLHAWELLKQRKKSLVWIQARPARLLLGSGMALAEGAAMPRWSAAASPRTMQKNRGRAISSIVVPPAFGNWSNKEA